MNKVRIRKATTKDFSAIFLLLKQLWPDKELHTDDMKKVYVRGIDSNSDEYFCAEIHNRVVGFCSLTIKSIFEIESLVGKINELSQNNGN